MLRRIAESIDPRDKTPKRRRAILEIAARDFLTQLRAKKGSKGGRGYDGWELSRLCDAMFWAMLLLSQRRERYGIRLLGQVHADTKALRPYVAEKRAAKQVLEAVPGIDPDSLIGFVDVAIMHFRPPASTGTPLVPAEEAVELLKASALRGAMVGELRPESAREAWLAGHRRGHKDPKDDESRWKVAQGRAETLARRWQEQRGSGPRRLI